VRASSFLPTHESVHRVRIQPGPLQLVTRETSTKHRVVVFVFGDILIICLRIMELQKGKLVDIRCLSSSLKVLVRGKGCAITVVRCVDGAKDTVKVETREKELP